MKFSKGESVPRAVAILCLTALVLPAVGSIMSLTAASQEKPHEIIPAIIASGLDAYKAKGPEEAVKAWIKGSPLEGSKDALTQANNLRQIQDYYGGYQSADLIGDQKISPTTRVYYLTLNFENGPLFARFLLYRKDQIWVLTSFNFNTNYEVILPSRLLDR